MDQKIRAYMNLTSAYQPKVIPKKGTFTFFSRKSGMPQIWTLDEAQNPVQYAEFDDTVISVYHSHNGDMSVVGKDNNGNEKQQFYLLLEDGRKTEVLVESPEHFHHFGGWSPDGQHIAYSSNRRHPGFFDVFIQNVVTKEVKTVFEYDGNCDPVTWLPDGEHILIDLPENSLDHNIYKLNIKTGEVTKFGKKNARFQSFSFTKDMKGGYVLTDLDEETLYVSRFSFDNPHSLEKVIHSEKWDIQEYKISSVEQKIVYTVNEGGIFKLYILDLTSKENKVIEGLPKGVIESISWVNKDEFVFGVNTPTTPGDIWKYSLATDKAERLTYISHSDEIGDQLVEPELCTFKSFDGLEVPYFYYEKNKDENKPALDYVHGGPTVQTRAEFNYYIQYLVGQGFAVAAPNVRGSSGYGRTYILLDDVRKRMDSVKDLVSLVDDLVETHKVNPEKIGIMGRSYGGFMVNASITHYPDLWAAAASLVGISSFKTFMQTTGEWRRKLRGSEYGTIEEDLEFFEEIDPLNHSHKIKTPLLVFHGLNDSRVPVTESIQLVKAMKERRQDVELTIFNNEGHFTEKIENHITMDGNIVKFMEKHLLED